MQLKYNNEQTYVYNKNQIYCEYKKWLQQNGVLVDPRIRYPSYFGQKNKGVVGVSTSKPIQKNKVVIAVPYNLLITVQKVLNVEILCKIVKQNPEIFNVIQGGVTKMLVLFVCYQLLKQQKSFYYPYFQIAQQTCLQKWKSMQLNALEDKILAKSLKKQKDQISRYFMQFLRIFTKYDDVFPQKGNNFYQKLFDRAYTFVSTRAFGWSLPSISLIPMADSLNHGNSYLDHFLIDTEEEKKPSETYLCKKDKVNLSLINKQYLMPSQEILAQLRRKKKRRYEKFVQKHKQILNSAKQLYQLSTLTSSTKSQAPTSLQRNKQYFILCQQYKSQIHTFRQLNFYSSSCSEDNDTQQDQLTQFVMKRQKFQFDEKYVKRKNENKEIENKSSKSIKNISNNNKGNGSNSSKKNITKDYWKLWMDNKLDNDMKNQQQEEDDEQIEEFDKKVQTNKQQLIQNYQQRKLQSQGSSSLSQTQSSQDDEEFDWMKPYQNNNYQNCYFVMKTRQFFRQNQQMHNFYGRRSNRFLLQAYNFVMNNNQYDSFSFRMIIDTELNVKPSADKLIFIGNDNGKIKKQTFLTRQIRLKSQNINIQLINHCRAYTIQFQKTQLLFIPTITVPYDRQIQLKTLKFYKQFIQSLYNHFISHIQQDYEILQKPLNYQLRTAVSYRILQKQILQKQKNIMQKCIDFLSKRWKNGKIDKPTWKDMKNVKEIRRYIDGLERGRVK